MRKGQIERWLSENQYVWKNRDISERGECMIPGCSNPRHNQGNDRFRATCWPCHLIRYPKAQGYRYHKKDYCENPDCTATIVHTCQLEGHHIDSNRSNNEAENIQTLCCNCHQLITLGIVEGY